MKREICAAEKPNKTRKKDGDFHRPFLFDFSCFRVKIVKKQSHYLREFAVRQPAPPARAGVLRIREDRLRIIFQLFARPGDSAARKVLSKPMPGGRGGFSQKVKAAICCAAARARRRVPTRGESEQTAFANRKYRARPDLSLYLADRDKPCPYGVRKTAVTGTKNMDGD